MTIVQISAWFMVVFSGLFGGGLLVFAVERTNLWRRMPVEQYAVDFRRSLRRAALLPMSGVIGALGGVVFALGTAGLTAAFAWTGAALIAVVFVATVVIAGPINSKFIRGDEGEVPAGAEQLRSAWRRFHWARTFVALAAVGCFAAAAAA